VDLLGDAELEALGKAFGNGDGAVVANHVAGGQEVIADDGLAKALGRGAAVLASGVTKMPVGPS